MDILGVVFLKHVFFYRDGFIDLKTGQKEVSSALEILGAKAPGYIEQVIDAMSYPQFEGCLDLVE